MVFLEIYWVFNGIFKGLFSQEEEGETEADFLVLQEKPLSSFNKLALKSISFHKFAENPPSRLLKAMISPKNAMSFKNQEIEPAKINRKKAVSICEKRSPLPITPKAQMDKKLIIEKKKPKLTFNKENQNNPRGSKPPTNKKLAVPQKKPMVFSLKSNLIK